MQRIVLDHSIAWWLDDLVGMGGLDLDEIIIYAEPRELPEFFGGARKRLRLTSTKLGNKQRLQNKRLSWLEQAEHKAKEVIDERRNIADEPSKLLGRE
jgi:hypothetical protein